LGFSIECNKFAPPATKAHFAARTYLEGEAILDEARRPTPTMLPETPGFVAAMDAAAPWTPIGVILAMSEPNGPVEHGFFEEVVDAMTGRLKAAMPVDGVYFCAHGAAITTEEDDPEGEMIELGQSKINPAIMNVSVMGGFAYADTAKNGLSVIVTARGDRSAAASLAAEIAQYGWEQRARFYPKLTSLEDAVQKALAAAR